MKFIELDRKMRLYETSWDQYVLPELYIVIRLDGRGFTKLTKETLALDKPFDIRFRDAIISTVEHLMNCGFNVIYGFTQSDEISLLLHRNENSFERKTRKLISVLAGEASAKFTSEIGYMGAFDCRISTLPTETLVVDYFRWRSEDAHRNSLNAWCYWKLREHGNSRKEATQLLSGMSVGGKNEVLYQFGINYNDLPNWQKRGIGFYYEKRIKKAINPLDDQPISLVKRVLTCDLHLPVDADYSHFINQILTDSVIH